MNRPMTEEEYLSALGRLSRSAHERYLAEAANSCDEQTDEEAGR